MSLRGWRPARSFARPVSLAAAVLGVVLGLAACQRRSNIVLVPPDSTASGVVDSSVIALRDAQQMWESGDPQAAAAATAKVLARDFIGHEPGEWRERASYLMDSLGVGGEFADAPCALMVNFFSRSNPEGGSWPYLYWCGTKGAAVQEIEGKNMHLQSIIARGVVATGVGADSVQRVAAAFVRRSAGGAQPLVMTWALPVKGAEHWTVLQTLGADSLGGFGTANFEGVSGLSPELVVRSYRIAPGFVECATCPHAYSTSRFTWDAQGFTRTVTKAVASPYATFASFIHALVSNNRIVAEEFVSDPTLVLTATRLEWHVKKGPWRTAPGDSESPSSMTFLRGPKDAYAVHFRSQGQGWVITGFEPSTALAE